jgi:type II secretory pathway pseudopilin PulG/5-hydroxyisourate hydrolase-like protein (transthyretin family)
MNEPNPPNPAPGQGPNDTAANVKRTRNPFIRAVASLLAAAVLAVGGYSIYVAVHEPDPQETIILGQTKIASGTSAAFRILVRNHVSDKPVAGAAVELSLLSKTAGTIKLGLFHTDASGSIADSIGIPDVAPGEYQLVVDSVSPLGRDHIVKKVEIEHPARVLLSSDKPIYQPGQTIHLRSLIINERTQKPFANEPVTFEISDPKGNKVFKETRKASAHGIASADFVLADELNLGRYEIRAIAGPTTGERTVEIKRYVLPKFKIQITTDKPYYLPGQKVTGSVQAAYFFGKPVGNGDVKLAVATFEETPVVMTELHGRTDATGNYSFQFVLPDFFAGMPQKNEQAFLDLTATVSDTAQHLEEKTLSLSVAQNELEIAAIPEAGAFVPGVENILYILTTYPDGRPAVCKIVVEGKTYQSDSQGVCVVKTVPTSADQQFEVQALDAAGRNRKIAFRPETRGESPTLLMRSDKAIYQAGEIAHISLLSTEMNNTVFIDVIKDGQTVLTKSVSLDKQRGQYSLSLPASLVGALKLNAYIITEAGEDRGCSCVVYVNPASGLRIAAKLSQPVYRPGQIAKVDFTVTDTTGQPAPAALGISAVDGSVFALAENRPGLLQQFLDVEADLLKPRYQIKFFDSPAGLIEAGDQTLAQAYFASLGEQRTGPSTDEFVKNGYIPQKLIDHVQSLRGTPAYEALRNDPQYAAILREVEGGGGLYSLRETTGPTKLQAVEAHRKAYFNRLKTALVVSFCGLLFLLPICLVIYSARQGIGIFPKALDTEENRRYAALASSSYHLLAALTLFPFLFYPFGALLCERSGIRDPGWMLLAFEVTVVFLTLALQIIRISKAKSYRFGGELEPLRIYLFAFLGQYILSRLGIVLAVYHPFRIEPLLPLVWILGSIIAPLMVLGSLGNHIRRQMTARGIPVPQAQITLVGILVIISMIAVLAAMLLPALAKAKSAAQRSSLVNDLKQIDLANRIAEEEGIKPTEGGSAQPRVRRDFPETLFWRPEFITDDHGKASLEIPMADSITTWRASVDGISASGKMGSIEMPITVFQDFFADLDLPVSLSLGDQVSVPVTCYNYLKEPQDIRLHLAPANWFESPTQDLTIHLGANEVRSVDFTIKVLRVGTHAARVTAQGTKIADAVEREVRVVPTGEPIEYTKNDVLKNVFTDTFMVQPQTIPDSQSLWVKFYPSRFSEVVEGLDSIFQAPNGCFEQTSSTTYPNVLALDYLKRMGRLTPEIEIKAQKYINAGYQRLLTFEVPNGGFEWFGHAPAHVGLTAYGILEFTDMAHVHPVDQAMIERTKKWLYSQQNSDGTWDATFGLRHEQNADSPVTAYVAWALAETGDDSPTLDKALNYLRFHPEKLADNYQKALAANAFLARNRNDAFGMELMKQLRDAAITGDRMMHWSSPGYSMTYSHGFGMEVETTALCTMAMIKAGLWPESVKEALTWITRQKTFNGTWGSTQATILAMRALILGSGASLGQEFESTVTVLLNGEKIETFRINKENSDVMRQIELTKHLQTGDNRLELRQSPTGELPVQVSGVYWLPANPSAAMTPAHQPEPLQIDLQYDRATLTVNALLKCTVTVKNNTGNMVNMAIVDLGIPPGFDVDTSAFEAMQQNGQVAKFDVTGNQVILYLRELSESTPFQFSYSLRAKYPLRVQTPRSTVYEYYQPQNRAESEPVTLRVADN